MIGAVVLAAGSGKRYGYQSKLLASFDGVPLITHALRAVDETRLAKIVLVTGRHHARVARAARRSIKPASRLQIVRNTRYRDGMASSLQTGLNALPARYDAALICLADMPCIDVNVIRRLIRRWHAGLDYIRPIHAGRPGHPTLVSRRLFASIDKLGGDEGAQNLLAQVPTARRQLVPMARSSVIDLDTPQALRRAAVRRS